MFKLPEETPIGHLIPPGQVRVTLPEHLRVAVHFGPRDEIVAMATIHMTDLEDLVGAQRGLKPIFHCNAKPLALGPGVGLDPRRHAFVSPNTKYTNMLVYFGVT